jgi:hypothetical protein
MDEIINSFLSHPALVGLKLLWWSNNCLYCHWLERDLLLQHLSNKLEKLGCVH